jgi:hypothetical protein
MGNCLKKKEGFGKKNGPDSFKTNQVHFMFEF